MTTLEVLRGVRELIARAADSNARNAELPGDGDIGVLHVVEENSSGYLEFTSRRTLRYAGGGKWEIFPGTYTLWHANGGSVYYWRPVSASLLERAAALLDRAIEAEAKAGGAEP